MGGMGRFRFVKARNYKDYWIINELVEQCNEEGKDGRFRWCYAPREHITLPHIDEDVEAKLVVTKDKVPKIVGFYSYTTLDKRLDVLYVVPNKRGHHIATDIVDNFLKMFPRERELYVLNPCRAVRKMLNKHYPGRFVAVMADGGSVHTLHFEEEDLAFSH
jgi:hypothetical protein